MKRKAEYVAGIFIANDFIYVDAVKNEPHIRFSQEGIAATGGRIKATKRLSDDLVKAVRVIENRVGDHGFVDTIAIAIIGPIHPSGVAQPIGKADIVINHRWDDERKEIDLGKAIRGALAKVRPLRAIDHETRIVALSDACAYAMGDYSITYGGKTGGILSPVLIHLTVDHGVSGAVVTRDGLLHPELQLEMGHMPVFRSEYDVEDFEPMCVWHSWPDCFESYAALPSIEKRWGLNAEQFEALSSDDDRLKLIAFYVAQLCISLKLAVSPNEISFSGRVMRNRQIVELARDYMAQRLRPIGERIGPQEKKVRLAQSTIIRGRGEQNAGIYGCILLASSYSNG